MKAKFLAAHGKTRAIAAFFLIVAVFYPVESATSWWDYVPGSAWLRGQQIPAKKPSGVQPAQQSLQSVPRLYPSLPQQEGTAAASSGLTHSVGVPAERIPVTTQAAASSQEKSTQTWWSRAKAWFGGARSQEGPKPVAPQKTELNAQEQQTQRIIESQQAQAERNIGAAQRMRESEAGRIAEAKTLLKNEGLWATFLSRKIGLPGEITLKTAFKYVGLAALTGAVAWVFAENGVPILSQVGEIASSAIPLAFSVSATYAQLCLARDLQDIEKKTEILLSKARLTQQASTASGELNLQGVRESIQRSFNEAIKNVEVTGKALEDATKALDEAEKEYAFRAEASQYIKVKIFGYPILEVQAPLGIGTAIRTLGIHAGLLFLCLAVSKGALPIPTGIPKIVADQYLQNASQISSLMMIYSSLTAIHDITKYSEEVKSWLETNGTWIAAALKATSAIAGLGAVGGFVYWISRYLQGVEANNAFEQAVENGIKNAASTVITGDTIVRGGAAFACVFVAAGITLYPQVFEALPFAIDVEEKVKLVEPGQVGGQEAASTAPSSEQAPAKSWWRFW